MVPSSNRIHILAVSILLVLISAPSASASPSAACSPNQPPPPPNVGTLAEYMGRSGGEPEPFYVSRVGVSLLEDRARLASGQMMAGLSVISVEHFSPAEDAGIRSERVPASTTAAKVGLGALAIGGTLFFPPAALGLVAIQKVHWNKLRDVIVAVDAERIRNLCELEAMLRKAKAGEIVYLTVIREGRREQLQITAPSGFDAEF